MTQLALLRPAGGRAKVAGPAAAVDTTRERTLVPTDTATFDAFWLASHDRVQRALALALGDAGLAAEASDEAFTRAYQHWHRIGDYAAPAGWCYRVGLNWATSWRRKAARRPVRPIEELDAGVDDVHLDPVDRRLAAALRALPQQQRTAVVARHYLDLSLPQVADLLGTSESTARTHLSRGLQQLRATLASGGTR